MQKLLLVYYHSENPKSRHKPNLENTSKYGFSPDLGGKNGGVLSMRMQAILDSSFARPGSAPIWGGKKGEFRDWTSSYHANKTETCTICLFDSQILFCKRAGNVGGNAIKHYLKRLWLVAIATILSKTSKTSKIAIAHNWSFFTKFKQTFWSI